MFCINCILEVCAEQRRAKVSLNNTFKTGDCFYGAPTIRVIDAAWNLQIEVKWDRSPEQIEEMIEAAESLGDGAHVTIAQEVYLMNGREGTYLDEGYELQVYPSLRLRAGNTYLPVPPREGDDHHLDN